MTLKRKLGIGAVLVVVMAGLVALFRDTEPGPPCTATFVRYEGSITAYEGSKTAVISNRAVIRITSRSRFDLHYGAGEFLITTEGALMAATSSVTNRLRAFESHEVSVALVLGNIIYVRSLSKPPTIKFLALRFVEKIGGKTPLHAYWETNVNLPSPNPPLP